MKARMTMVAAIAIAAAALAVGCGGDDDSGAPESAAGGEVETAQSETPSGDSADATSPGGEVATGDLSKSQYVKQANAACNKARKELFEKMTARLGQEEKRGTPRGQAIANMFQAVFVPVVEAEIEALRELGAPKGDQPQVEAFVAGQEGALEEVKRLETAKSLKDFEERFRKVDSLLVDYGLIECTKSQ